MEKKEVKERIEKLKKTINHHRYLYHVLDRQEISDSALDSLKKELFDLEQKFPDFVTPDSPTQRVGGEPLKKFKKVKHISPMLSFNDAFSKKDVEDWILRISKLLTKEEQKNIDFFSELKIDGLAVELVYEDGILHKGSTRGDGLIGEDITQNIKTIESIPLKIEIQNLKLKISQPQVVIRGEVFISKKEFARVNVERKKNNETPYANPRNLAAGSVRQLDSKIIAFRKLDFFAYDLLDNDLTTHEQKHKILKELGFKVNNYNKYCNGLKEVFSYYNNIQKIRENIPYEIDGIVLIVNNNKIYEKLGNVGKAPRGAIAFKFPGKQATTIVEDIQVQVGRTGVLTPVAFLKPVEVAGAMISKATLHNEDEIKRLGIKIGDTVVVGRAGDVIPDIVEVLKGLRTGKEKDFKMPQNCPSCNSRVLRVKGEAAHKCSNPNCFAQKKEYFYYFVSKQAFNIEGLGPKIVDQLIAGNLASDPADIFKLKQGDLIPLERLAQKSAKNIVEAIQKKREIEFSKFIYALGIKNVGEETAFDLSKNFSNLEELKNASRQDLENIKDIGPIVAGSIYDWFQNKNNKKYLEKLLKNIKIKNYQPSTVNYKTKDKIFVFTGNLESMTRDEVKKRVRVMGGNISESVSKETDYLVVGENPGSKYQKAKNLSIKIINEKEFLRLINS